MRALIVAGGEKPSEGLLKHIKEEKFDLIIGADKGSEILFDENITTTHIVGDFDSADTEKIDKFKKRGLEVVKYKAEKDFTDSESAFNLAIENGATDIVMIGVTGTRFDHTMANIGLVFKGLAKGVSVIIYNNNNKIYMISKSTRIKFAEGYEYIAFLAYKKDVKELSINNAKYNIEKYDLKIEDGITVSNEFIDEEDIKVTFEEGILMVIHSKD